MTTGTDLKKPVMTPPSSELIEVIGRINPRYIQKPGKEFICKKISATSLCISPKKKKIKKTPKIPPT